MDPFGHLKTISLDLLNYALPKLNYSTNDKQFLSSTGTRTNEQQLPRYQKLMLLKPLDVDSAGTAIKLP